MATGKKNGMTCTYVVGRYRPMGNMGGQYKDNVPKGSFTTAACSKLKDVINELEKGTAEGGGNAGGAGNADDSSGGSPGFKAPGQPGQAEAPPGGGAPSGGGAEGTTFQKGGLLAHNKFRKIHGTPAMTLNAKMCDEAQAYAEVLAKKGRLEHAKVKDGENLAYGCSSGPGAKLSGAEATKRW